MATDTIREQVRISSALLADFSNAISPFQKNVFIFAHRYVAGTDYTATNDIVIELDGAQEVLYCSTMEMITTTTDIAHTVAALSGTGRQGKSITTAATNASSVSVHLFAIVRV